jgi:tetratricopeptide (TPR) repeat protein
LALMAIKGSLKEASLPDVIQLLFLGRRTGCLAVADGQNFGTIYFNEGQIVSASIVNRRDRLGDMLVRNHRITAEQLARAVDAQARSRDRRLGVILVEQGAISPQALADYVRLQVEEAVYFLFTWTSGTFNFESGVLPEADTGLRINPEMLLLEGARRVDEWSVIQKKIPSFDLLFTADREHVGQSDAALSPVQQQILPLLDGSRDVQQVVEDAGLVEFEVGQALYGLITAGFAHRTGTSAATAAPRANEARIEEHRNLGIAFYKTGMLDEAQREFRRVADLRPSEGSAPFYLGLIALRQGRWADAEHALRLAREKGGPRAAALHNLGYALEQQGRLEDAEAAYGEAAGRAREDTRILLGWAIVGIKRGDHAVALERLARARELLGTRTPSAVWFWAATLAHVAARDPEHALSTARAGVAAHAGCAVLRNNLAVLLEAAGDLTDAEGELRAGLAEDPSLPQIAKNLADLYYRAGRYDAAFETYERAAKLDPELGDDLYFKLGNLAFKRGDRARARANWERATQLNPGHQLARANLDTLGAV